MLHRLGACLISIDSAASGDKVILKADARTILLLTLAIQSAAPRRPTEHMKRHQLQDSGRFSKVFQKATKDTHKKSMDNYDDGVLKPPVLVSMLIFKCLPTSKTPIWIAKWCRRQDVPIISAPFGIVKRQRWGKACTNGMKTTHTYK